MTDPIFALEVSELRRERDQLRIELASKDKDIARLLAEKKKDIARIRRALGEMRGEFEPKRESAS